MGSMSVFRHADVVCLVCILWQFSMLHDLQFVKIKCWSRMQEGGIWKRHAPEPVS